MKTLQAFRPSEKALAKQLLATRVAQMMGRKFEEGDWSSVYCAAKKIPEKGWSNLHIDVMHEGLGVEHKMLCVGEGKALMSFAGTTQMHPSATRSIRIDSTSVQPDVAMKDVFRQYAALINDRTQKVKSSSPTGAADMRTGWLIWERTLSEFLYFEEKMEAPSPENYWAEWNETKARGVRKASKNLWIYEKGSNKKRYSITTSAGIKIQPYFDIPAPNDPNLVYFCVQGEEVKGDKILLWLTVRTANALRKLLGKLDTPTLSEAILLAAENVKAAEVLNIGTSDMALSVEITKTAYAALKAKWAGVSDEHRVQLLVSTLEHS